MGIPSGHVLRELRAGDGEVLAEATLINLNWEHERFTAADVRERPEFSHYAVVDPERGDFGFVVERGTVWVGVVWCLLLPEEDPGYGFVRVDVPELSVCVRPATQRRGIGTALVGAALTAGAERGHSQLSLSVEPGNPAKRLYEAMGFVSAGESTMLVDLSSA